MSFLKKIWKESATLIILGRNANNIVQNGCNYKVLVMKRSSKSSFMPNAIVFPGGAIESSDSDPNWLTMYKSFGIKQSFDDLNPTVQSDSIQRPFIFDALHSIHRDSNDSNSDSVATNQLPEIDRNISLRISAIRETFEELGILIAKTSEQFKNVAGFSEMYENFGRQKWQEEIHKDHTKFINLCRKNNVLPDIWSLYEWSDWLTPASFGKKRFDTAFYLVALQDQPDVVADKIEVQEFMWASPEELFKLYYENKISLQPPQFYELSRLHKIADLDSVVEFCKKRNSFGTECYFPLQYFIKGAVVFIYPGDDLYPKEPDFMGGKHDSKRFSDKSSSEFHGMYKNLNRMEHFANDNGEISVRLFYNIKSPVNHLSPSEVHFNSKL